MAVHRRASYCKSPKDKLLDECCSLAVLGIHHQRFPVVLTL